MTPVNERLARAFDGLAGDYDDAHHDAIATELTDWLAPAAEEVVADVACGTGAVALAVARRRAAHGPAEVADPTPATDPAPVSGTGAWAPVRRPVLAVDLSAGMVAAGRARAERAGFAAAVDWRVAAAVPLPVPDGSVDVLLCASSLHFLGTAAPADWLRAVRPGGRVGFSLPVASGFRPGGVFAELVAGDLVLPETVAEAVLLAGSWGFARPEARILTLGTRAVVLVRAAVPA
ncbi:methyltransferase domain-containing protein [Streptomyces sp. NPDC097619]|uniref:class I SAM-dependent methyltransferase n=1 Tax=Streptomyces sp. NPDC097619 TaxID=3157228 RepID=UPI00332C94EA